MIAYHRIERPDSLPGDDLDRYLAAGWFRMHQEIFTTTHLFAGDEAFRVHWLRYEVSAIQEKAYHRRLRRRSAGFFVTIEDAERIPQAQVELYSAYRASIDFEGADSITHALFGEEQPQTNIYRTKCISIYHGDRLIAAGYFDLGEHAGASILHFFDPEYSRYSLGKYLILITLDYFREHKIDLYYPGYVVAGKEKMNYKLFLGKDIATYYDPLTHSWRPFDERILQPEVLSELDRLNLAVALLS